MEKEEKVRIHLLKGGKNMSRMSARYIAPKMGMTASSVYSTWEKMGLVMKNKYGDWRNK